MSCYFKYNKERRWHAVHSSRVFIISDITRKWG